MNSYYFNPHYGPSCFNIDVRCDYADPIPFLYRNWKLQLPAFLYSQT